MRRGRESGCGEGMKSLVSYIMIMIAVVVMVAAVIPFLLSCLLIEFSRWVDDGRK